MSKTVYKKVTTDAAQIDVATYFLPLQQCFSTFFSRGDDTLYKKNNLYDTFETFQL